MISSDQHQNQHQSLTTYMSVIATTTCGARSVSTTTSMTTLSSYLTNFLLRAVSEIAGVGIVSACHCAGFLHYSNVEY